MGRILETPDGEVLSDHEGYVAHVLRDGTCAYDNWSFVVERDTVAWRAQCICGWHGPEHDSGGPATPNDAQYEAVMADWDNIHAPILLRATEVIDHLQAIETANTNLWAALRQAAANGITPDHLAGTLRISTAELHRRYPQLQVADNPNTTDSRLVGRAGEGQRWLLRNDRPPQHLENYDSQLCRAQVPDTRLSVAQEAPSL